MLRYKLISHKERTMFRNLSLMYFRICFFVFTMAPVVAYSQQASSSVPASQSWWQNLIWNLITIFAPIVAGVFTVLVFRIANRYGIHLEKSQVESIVNKSIGYAEEKARQALNEGKEKTSGAKKAQIAADMAKLLASQYKLNDKAIEGLDKLIVAKLGESRSENKKEQA